MDDQEAKSLAREFIVQHPVASVGTLDDEGFPHIRPMYTVNLGNDFTVYFATARNLVKNREITNNPKVAVSWSAYSRDMEAWSHIQIKGLATIRDDEELKRRLWFDALKMYFPEGVDDPNYVILEVKPRELLFTDEQRYPPYRIEFQPVEENVSQSI